MFTKIDNLINSPLYYKDNGFPSNVMMTLAHTPLVNFIVSKTQTLVEGNIIDFGCGNGALLKKILECRPNLVPFGIDISYERIERSWLFFPNYIKNFIVGDIFESFLPIFGNIHFFVSILMPGRLLEVANAKRMLLLSFLQKNCRSIFVYAYGDWIKKFNSFENLIALSGLELLEKHSSSAVGLAQVKNN